MQTSGQRPPVALVCVTHSPSLRRSHLPRWGHTAWRPLGETNQSRTPVSPLSEGWGSPLRAQRAPHHLPRVSKAAAGLARGSWQQGPLRRGGERGRAALNSWDPLAEQTQSGLQPRQQQTHRPS